MSIYEFEIGWAETADDDRRYLLFKCANWRTFRLRLTGWFGKSSDGLEPSTPSLP
jgi:hypothetical protein